MTAANALAARINAALEAVRVWIAKALKFVVAVAGAAASLLAAGLLPEPVAGYVAMSLAILASLGVYAAPNAGVTRAPSGTLANDPAASGTFTAGPPRV